MPAASGAPKIPWRQNPRFTIAIWLKEERFPDMRYPQFLKIFNAMFDHQLRDAGFANGVPADQSDKLGAFFRESRKEKNAAWWPPLKEKELNVDEGQTVEMIYVAIRCWAQHFDIQIPYDEDLDGESEGEEEGPPEDDPQPETWDEEWKVVWDEAHEREKLKRKFDARLIGGTNGHDGNLEAMNDETSMQEYEEWEKIQEKHRADGQLRCEKEKGK